MDNISTQPFLNTFDGIAPRQETSHNVDRVIRQVKEEDYQKKLDALEAKEANFQKYKKRETEKLEAKQKVVYEQEARNKRDGNLIDADKKRVNEQSKQVLQDKAKNDEKEKELSLFANQLGEKEYEINHSLSSTKDDYLVSQSLLRKAETLVNHILELQTNFLSKDNEQFAILFQKLADNDVKNDLILEELNKLEAPQLNKRTKSKSHSDQLNLFHAESETTQTIKVLSSDYIFRLKDGDSYDECINITDFIDTYSHLSLTSEDMDQFFSTFEFVFSEGDEPLLEVGFNDLHKDTQNDLLNIFS